ncbi:MAG: PHP domain-containing protein [Candidatus Delongbacteria bacterium]|nr:PHP domain-containing protein [Candidatus Delongbacteria bacterium]
MMSPLVDLHIHTTHSDGTQSVQDVIDIAVQQRLKAIAITDHDTVSGMPEAFAYIREKGLELGLISGVELSTRFENLDVHVLGYCFDHDNQDFLKIIEYYKLKREHRAEKIVDRLHELGFPVSMDLIREMAQSGSIGRPHIARALVESGLMPSVDYAFNYYLGYYKPAYVHKEKLTPEQGIAYIHQAGGIAVLAHPGSYFSDPLLDQFLEFGLDGIEVFHPNHGNEMVMELIKGAKKRNLLITGGSDNHGSVKSDTYIGAIRVPYVFYEKLLAYHQNIKQTV